LEGRVFAGEREGGIFTARKKKGNLLYVSALLSSEQKKRGKRGLRWSKGEKGALISLRRHRRGGACKQRGGELNI